MSARPGDRGPPSLRSGDDVELIQHPVDLDAAHETDRIVSLAPAAADADREFSVDTQDRCFLVTLEGRLEARADIVRVTMSSDDQTGDLHQLVVNEHGYATDGIHLARCEGNDHSPDRDFDIMMLVDTGSLEVFVDGGRAVATSIVGIGLGSTSVKLEASAGVRFERCEITPLRLPS